MSQTNSSRAAQLSAATRHEPEFEAIPLSQTTQSPHTADSARLEVTEVSTVPSNADLDYAWRGDAYGLSSSAGPDDLYTLSPKFEMVGTGRDTGLQANYDFLHSSNSNIQSVLDTAMVNSVSIDGSWVTGSTPMTNGDDPSYIDLGINLVGDRIKSYIGDMEALSAIGSSFVGEVVSGLTMMMTGGDVGAGRAVGEAFAYMPRTDYGQQRLQMVGEIMEPVAQGLEWTRTTLGDFGYEVGGAWLGAGLYTLPDAILAFAAPQSRAAFGAVGSSAYSGLKATGRVFAPAAGRMAESFLDSQGLVFRVVPDGPRSVPKPGDYDFMGPLVGPDSTRLLSGTEGVVTGGNSKALGQNMLEAMGLDKNLSWGGKDWGYQAQHIIPSQMKNHPILQKVGIELDDASNGAFLRIPDDGLSPMARHRGFHSVYNQVVKKQLDSMDLNLPATTLEQQVFKLQKNLRTLQESGLPLYKGGGRNAPINQRHGATVDLWERWLNKLNQ